MFYSSFHFEISKWKKVIAMKILEVYAFKHILKGIWSFFCLCKTSDNSRYSFYNTVGYRMSKFLSVISADLFYYLGFMRQFYYKYF